MKPESSQDLYIVSSSPHAHSGESVERIMLDVVIALMPALAAALWFFRLDALRLTAVCVGTCLLTEWLCRKAMRRAGTLSDFSAAVTGLLYIDLRMRREALDIELVSAGVQLSPDPLAPYRNHRP